MGVRQLLGRLSRRQWITLGASVMVLAVAVVVVFGFVLPSQGGQTQQITQTATASLQTMQKVVSTNGTVSPAVKEDLSFAVSGTVVEVSVAAGDVVEEGAALARVDTLELDASLLDAKASLAEAEASLASAQNANDGSDATEARVSAASAAVDVARAAVSDAEAALEDATLRAPAAGLITSVGVSIGDRMGGSSGSSGSTPGGAGSDSSTSASTAAFSLVSTDAWTVDVTVGETDIANVATGLQVELTTSEGLELFGTVTEVGLVPSTSSGSARYPVSVDVTGDGEGLFDGVSVEVEIVYERRTDVLTVPAAAVTTTEGVSTVTVIRADGSEEEVQVEIGETSGSLTEVVSGINEGDEVLVTVFTPGEGNTGGGFPGGGGFEPPDGPRVPGGGQGVPGGNQ